MRDMCVGLGLRGKWGLEVYKALAAVKTAARDASGLRWQAIGLGAVGAALLAAGPLGMALAMPSGLAGAAAITSGLAALGPGGMLGGIATVAGVTSTGAAATTRAMSKATVATTPVEQLATDLVIRVAIEQARDNLPGVERDDETWLVLADRERDVAAELRKLSAFSDPGSPRVKDLEKKQQLIKRLIDYMIDNELAPEGSAT
jgi:membrane protein implicated in regulation of membrane protease activity